ncbi:hypothetical protein BDP27DRAFT_1344630 [Rhodocollybia butyracea]|uniref:Uncharacterized protein n=1 Tax=Rhodocollybia butyracea TaxID=206335 RepID=A0A9P5P6G4_9AGAR|nr:hypothetical protein BDP27DRAFT_1344630 [Rhodocollybia butyracea]
MHSAGLLFLLIASSILAAPLPKDPSRDHYEIAPGALGEPGNAFPYATVEFIGKTGEHLDPIMGASTNSKKVFTQKLTENHGIFFTISGPLLPLCVPDCFGWITRGGQDKRDTLHMGIRIGSPTSITIDGPEAHAIIGKPKSELLGRTEWERLDNRAIAIFMKPEQQEGAVHQQQPGGHVYDPQLGSSVHNQHQGVPAQPPGHQAVQLPLSHQGVPAKPPGHQAVGHLQLPLLYQEVPAHPPQKKSPVPDSMSFRTILHPNPPTHQPPGSGSA